MEVVALERRSDAVGEEASGCGVGEREGGGRDGREGEGGGGCWGGAKVSEWWRRQEGEGRRRKRKPGWLSFSLWITMALSLAVASPSSAALDNEIHGILGTKAEPEFGDPIDNVTVAAGREARLSCVVDNLGNFRVGWLKVDSQTILSLQKRVVTHNTRISVTHDEHRTWNLHIRQVKESDRGCYMCQINTPIMKNRVGCIEVHVPPDIIYSLTSSDTTVNEGDNVNLRCVSEGYPTPEIKWKREDQRPIDIKSSNSQKALEKVTRKQMGAYLCIASNKVPPSVSKRIIVNVNFSPVVKVDNQLIGAPLGTAVTVECKVEAFPKAVNYWERDNGEMMLNNKKYELLEMVDSYRVTMQLTIRNFTREDEGKYKCISTNSLGKADTGIRIYVIEVYTAKPTTDTAYNSIQTTTHSKLSNAIDTRKREGQSKIREGISGIDGATASLGIDFPDNKQNRQRQMQRLDQTGEGRASNGVSILGGPFQQGDEENNQGGRSSASSASATSSISTLWMNIFLLKVLAASWGMMVQFARGEVFL
ncbi:neurotrimin-like [Macrobrachium nipponense]|uniref:neurotrimin-like n=1 Tax=Macrobrachium nipponense TaxID=159736 RepID=UPI0030C88F30